MAEPQAPTKYRKVLSEVFLENKISALDSHRLASSSTAAGARGVEDFARAGASGKCPQNLHRDVMRAVMKECDWPDFYYADIPVKDQNNNVSIVSLPFLLPHEVLWQLSERNQLGNAKTTRENAPKGIWKHCQQMSRLLGKPASNLYALGLHGDGAPCGANDSLEQLSWNLPAWQGSGYSPRFLICTVMKEFVCKETYPAIFEVLSWSFRMATLGQFPECRHDGSAWAKTDKQRAKQHGDLPVTAVLCQARGDWSFYKQVFGFPAWNAKHYMCWKCKASQDTMKDPSLNAPWRNERMLPNEFVQWQRADRIRPCPLFSVPGFGPELVLIDWLHTADMGIAADVLGNILHESLAKFPGPNQDARLKALWLDMQRFYQANGIQSKLWSLTAEMIKKPKSSPKLRGKASQIKALVPYAVDLTNRIFSNSPHDSTVKQVAQKLGQLYSYLEVDPWPEEDASTSCRQLVILMAALQHEQKMQDENSVSWRFKPKFHLFQELIEYTCPEQGTPKMFWTYRDEDFGGELAIMAARRGGPRNPAQIAKRVLQYFCCGERIEDVRM